jgi:hypothetical protein
MSALGTLTISVPDATGTAVTWTAVAFVDITSANLSALSTLDALNVYGSSTGAEPTAPAAQLVATVIVVGSPAKVVFTPAPSAWAAWPFFATTRQAGSSTGLTLTLNGNLGG